MRHGDQFSIFNGYGFDLNTEIGYNSRRSFYQQWVRRQQGPVGRARETLNQWQRDYDSYLDSIHSRYRSTW